MRPRVDGIDVVFACTGNICRSPMAEAILRDRLAARAPDVTIGSVGLRFDDRPAERGAVKAMARRGLDLEPFRSRVMTADLLAGSSLILGMEHQHVREVAVLDPELFGHTFTLPGLVDDAELFGPRPEDEDLRSWARRIGRLRTPSAYVGDRSSEVPDPMGRSARTFRACADLLADLIDRLVELAWPEPVLVDTPPTAVPGSPPPHHGGS